MGILEKFFPAKTTITSTTIQAEIDHSEAEIARLQAEIGPKLAAIATMTDAEHVKADADIAATKRAIARLDARIAHLTNELPTVIAAEEAAQKAEADKALKDRAEAARKENASTAKKLLASYAEHAEAIADIFAKLKTIDVERDAVNQALRSNPVAESVASYTDIHRKTSDQLAGEQREMRPCWVYTIRHAENWDDKWTHHDEEIVQQASLDEHGQPIPDARPVTNNALQSVTPPRIEMREVVVSRTQFRPGRYAPALSEVRLPPAFADNSGWHWPRS
jgi:hypothetical protein